MGKSNSHFRTFNTVKHSNRAAREKRLQTSRVFLLAICICLIAILVSLAALAFCSIANRSNGSNGSKNEPKIEDEQTLQYTEISVSNSRVREGPLIVVKQSDHKYLYPTVKMKALKDLRQSQSGATPYQLLTEEKMETTAAVAADKMLTDYYLTFKDGSLLLMDAYRTIEQQTGKTVPVGYSEHETGYLFTLETVKSGTRTLLAANTSEEYSWIYDNCAKYGIIARYPSDKTASTGISNYEEAFRYVGVAHATYIKNNNLCLEEYNELLRTTYTGDNHLKISGADNCRYEVYYVPASTGSETSVRVPTENEYTVSGDNLGGFIVTVKL